MAIQDEITGLRRLMESINKQCASNAQSAGKLMAEQAAQKACHQQTKQIAERGLQMCNDLTTRVTALEAVVKQLSQTSGR